MRSTQNFTEGKILSPLILFALPVLLAIFLQTMYGAVDMLIVGWFGSAADISAVSTGSWVMQTVTTAIVGLAMGTTILLGRKIGEGKSHEAGDVIGASLCLFAVIGAAVTLLMEIFAVPVTNIVKAPEEAFSSTVSYIRICSGGALFIVAYNVIGSIFRGMGNSKMPLITVAIACVQYYRRPFISRSIRYGCCRCGYCHSFCSGGKRCHICHNNQKAENALHIRQGQYPL